jgi:hypothetical protein
MAIKTLLTAKFKFDAEVSRVQRIALMTELRLLKGVTKRWLRMPEGSPHFFSENPCKI